MKAFNSTMGLIYVCSAGYFFEWSLISILIILIMAHKILQRNECLVNLGGHKDKVQIF